MTKKRYKIISVVTLLLMFTFTGCDGTSVSNPNEEYVVELYTDSTCNGSWFGLCQGTVIYVLTQPDDGSWYVKDIYAIE